VKVYILTTCNGPDNLTNTLMVFKTLRVGFPTAEVFVVDNASDAAVVPAIEDAATSVGAKFYRYSQRTEHGKFITAVVSTSTGALAFVDTDVAFWASCEGLDIEGALFGGRYIPKIETPTGVHIARVHPSLFIVPDAEKLWEACRHVAETGFRGIEFKPFESCYYVDSDGRTVLVDTCSGVSGALADRAYHFRPVDLERYDHLFLGTIPEMVDALPLHDDTRDVIAVGHTIERPEDLKGLWRQQNGRNFEWQYMSGKVGSLGVMTARFKEPTAGYEMAHVAIVDEGTARVIYAGPATKVVGDTFHFVGGKVTISVRNTCRVVEHGVAPVDDHGWSLHRSWPSVSANVTVEAEGRRLEDTGCDFWIDYETGLLPSRRGWTWASIRLDDGTKMMLYERSGRSELWELYDGLAIPIEYERLEHAISFEGRTLFLCPVAPGQIISDPFHSLTYGEALCRVIEDGRVVGRAYLEVVPDNWGDPRFSDTERQMHRRWTDGNEDAAALLHLLGEGSQLADDIVDRDIPEDEMSGAVTKLMGDMIVRLPANPFYAKHRATLEPVIMSSFLVWDATNDWAKSPRKETQMFAYTFREILGQIIGMVALLVGGLAFARRVTREVHLYYHSNRVESFEAWRKECGHG